MSKTLSGGQVRGVVGRRFSFNYLEYTKFEKSIGKIEEIVIKADFNEMIDGNDCYEHMSSLEMQHFYTVFRHGWLCARLALEPSNPEPSLAAAEDKSP